MKNFIYLIVVVLLTACGNSKIPNDVKWEIVKEEPNEPLSKSNVEVQLNKKVSEDILKEIALNIRKGRSQYDKLWILYYIPNMTNGIAWATTHFTPNLKVEIIGSTVKQDEETSKTDNLNGEILGKWRSEKSLEGAVLVLYKETKSKLKMRITFKDGSNMDSELNQSTVNGKTKYNDENGHGEYYMIESNGNLGMYGNDGKFDEAFKIE